MIGRLHFAVELQVGSVEGLLAQFGIGQPSQNGGLAILLSGVIRRLAIDQELYIGEVAFLYVGDNASGKRWQDLAIK